MLPRTDPADAAAELAFISGILADARKRASAGVGDGLVEELESKQTALRVAIQAERPLPARLQSAMDKALTRRAVQVEKEKERDALRGKLKLADEAVAAATQATDEADQALLVVQHEAAAVAAQGSVPLAPAPSLATVQADLQQVAVAMGQQVQAQALVDPPAVFQAVQDGLKALAMVQQQLAVLGLSVAGMGGGCSLGGGVGGGLEPSPPTPLSPTVPAAPGPQPLPPKSAHLQTAASIPASPPESAPALPPRERSRSPKGAKGADGSEGADEGDSAASGA